MGLGLELQLSLNSAKLEKEGGGGGEGEKGGRRGGVGSWGVEVVGCYAKYSALEFAKNPVS